MAFVTKEGRNISFLLNKTVNLGPGKYAPNSLNSTEVEECIVPFNTSVPRKFMEADPGDLATEEKVHLRNEFAYESDMIRSHLRKELPNKSFTSKIVRLPSEYRENAPDPGVFYTDPM